VTKSLGYEPSEDSDLDEKYDYASDSDLEDDGEAVESVTGTRDPAVGDQNPNATAGNRDELDHQGKVALLEGVSYLTSVRICSRSYTHLLKIWQPSGSRDVSVYQ